MRADPRTDETTTVQSAARRLGASPHAEPAQRTRPRSVQAWVARHAGTLAVILLALAATYRLALILHGWPPLDSDEAVTGLVARHIWLSGDHPLFFWGEQYMSALQAYLAVPFFAAFGATPAALHLATLALALAFLAVAYLLGRAAYGPVVGLLTLAWLAVGPPLAVQRELMASGGYEEILALGGLVLLCAWSRLRRPEPLPRDRSAWLRCLGVYAALGAAAGLALWSDPLILPLLGVAASGLLLGRRREALSWAGLAATASFLLVLAPVLLHNVANGFPSLASAAGVRDAGASSLAAEASPLILLGGQLRGLLGVELPMAFGSPLVCTPTGTSPQIPWLVALRPGGDACELGNVLFAELLLAVYVVAALALAHPVLARLKRGPARRHDGGDAPALSEMAAEALARRWLQAMLLGAAVATALLVATSAQSAAWPVAAARYLTPLYLSAPLLLGTLWQSTRPALIGLGRGWRRGAASPPTSPVRRPILGIAAAGLLALLLGLSALGGVRLLADASNTQAYGLPAPPADRQLLAFLGAHHVRTFYADYWTSFRLTFESGERIVGAVGTPDGRLATSTMENRYLPYVLAAASDPDRAYLVQPGAAEATAFASGPLPRAGYQRVVIAGYAVYVRAAPTP